MVGETGELAELFQWRPDTDCGVGLPGWTPSEREALEFELADVLLYLLQLSDACGVDLAPAAHRKIALNAIKYPPDPTSGKTTASKDDHMRAVLQLRASAPADAADNDGEAPRASTP